eukprot:Pgem_evm1s3782
MESKPFNYDGIQYHFRDEYMVSNPDYKPVIINNFYEKNECDILKKYIDSQNLNKGLVYDGSKEIEIDINNNPTLLTRFQLFCLESCGSNDNFYLEDTPRDGGQTYFPIIDVAVRPIEGRLVQFQAVDSYGKNYWQSLHCSLPLLNDNISKYIILQFVHYKKPFKTELGIDEKYLPVFNYDSNSMCSIHDYEPLIIEKFLSIDECSALISWIDTGNFLQRAGMYKDGKEGVVTDDRIAFEKRFLQNEGHPILEKVRNLHHQISNGDVSESILVVKYPSGGKLCPHRDNYPHSTDKFSIMGLRKSSLIVYLNTLCSGQTRFPIIDKSYDCIQGNALFFEDSDDDNKSIYESLHECLPIDENENKYIL